MFGTDYKDMGGHYERPMPKKNMIKEEMELVRVMAQLEYMIGRLNFSGTGELCYIWKMQEKMTKLREMVESQIIKEEPNA